LLTVGGLDTVPYVLQIIDLIDSSEPYGPLASLALALQYTNSSVAAKQKI
jgi:hypothetical protein